MLTVGAPKPLLRGWFHVAAFVVAFPAGIILIARADHAMARTAAAVYAATLLLSFGTSAAYHRLARSERSRAILQRLDHAMIYVLIAGTYVPASLLGLPLRWGIPLLSVVAAGAIIGMAIKLVAFDRRFVRFGYALYPILGWAALFVLPVLIENLSGATLALIVGGGLLYTVGFPVLMFQRPDPWPKVFGYHEVWHSFTIAAAVLHYGAVTNLVA